VKTAFNTPILVFIFMLGLGVAAFMLYPLFTDPKGQRLHNEAILFGVGKRVSAYIEQRQTIPKSAGDFKADGVLSDTDLIFFTEQKIVYTPPYSTSNLDQTLLIMPEDGGEVKCVIKLDGFMYWERTLTNY
jgi:hypothetical protein